MPDLIHKILKRLPSFRHMAEQLSGSNSAFDDLCHEFNIVSESIDDVGIADLETSDALATLKRRRQALEDQLIALMETNIRP